MACKILGISLAELDRREDWTSLHASEMCQPGLHGSISLASRRQVVLGGNFSFRPERTIRWQPAETPSAGTLLALRRLLRTFYAALRHHPGDADGSLERARESTLPGARGGHRLLIVEWGR